MAQKYVMYQDDTFGRFIGFILPFFLVIAYLIPLSMQVSRMVGEKESKAKEGMKIMGLTESIYFLSYFLQFFIQNTIYAIVNSVIMTQVFDDTGYIYLFAFFWLYGINIFAEGSLSKTYTTRLEMADSRFARCHRITRLL